MFKWMGVRWKTVISIGSVYITFLIQLSLCVNIPCSDRNFVSHSPSWVYTPHRMKYISIYCQPYFDMLDCFDICRGQGSCVGVVIDLNHTGEPCSICRNTENSLYPNEKELSEVMNKTNCLFFVHQTYAG